MKRLLFLLLVTAFCSGQMCGTTSDGSNNGGGDQNICGRQYFDSTYRVGWNPPTGVGSVHFGTLLPAAALNRAWTWNATSPATEFSLVVLKPTTETTLAQFRDAWLATFNDSDNGFTVLNEAYLTLSDGAQGWYLALSPNDKQGIISEFVMTATQQRLAYVNAIYSSDLATDAQVKQIGDALITLCADLQ